MAGRQLFSASFRCQSLHFTTQLAQSLAKTSYVGELFLLSGNLGAGKTSFAREYIRTLVEDPQLVVNSPSYLLDNTYELIDGSTIHHIDLYRLPQDCNLSILGIPDIYKQGTTFVEWPERAGLQSFIPYCPIHLTFVPDLEFRIIQIQAIGERSIDRILNLCQSSGSPIIS